MSRFRIISMPVFVLAFVLFLLSPAAAVAEQAPQGCTDHFFSGEMPAISQTAGDTTRLLCYSGFALLHSGLRKTPIWSAEHLTSDRVEATRTAGGRRGNTFHVETRLPANERASLADYRGATSEFDRGHMSAAGDMASRASKRESFTLANMIPQQACNNEELWEGIESAVRQLAEDEDEIFVVTGPVYSTSEEPRTIGDGVAVPSQIFKAVYLPSREEGAVYIALNADTKQAAAVTLDELRPLTGIDIFPSLPASIKQSALELPPPQPPRFRCRLR